MSSEVHPFLQKITEVVEAINSGDISVALRAVSTDFVRHDLTNSFVAREIGSDEAKSFLKNMMEIFSDLHFEIMETFYGGDHLTVNYKISGKHSGVIFDLPPTGEQITFNGINIYRFKDLKIAETWQLWDWVSVMRQIRKI